VCGQFDANFDEVLDINDFENWVDGFHGPDLTDGFYPWCY